MATNTVSPPNQILVAYGIQTEQSDLRIHVCVTAQWAYMYPTAAGLEAIATGRYPSRPVYTRSIQTAEGYLVPPQSIRDCVAVKIPPFLISRAAFRPEDSPTVKGRKAYQLAASLVDLRYFRLPLTVTEVEDRQLQYDGTDMIVAMRLRIQVKCDYHGGRKEHGGTGNLFLQTAECNPLRQH